MDLHSKLKQLKIYKNNYLYYIITNLYEGYKVSVTFQSNKKYNCYKNSTLKTLSNLGVHKNDMIIGNDAPRGGQLGNFIKLISMERNRIIDEILN